MKKKNICIAGKNSIVLSGLSYVLDNYKDEYNLFALGDKNDNFIDSWQPSFLKYAKENGVKIVNLEDLYELEDLSFISLEYFRLIDPLKFKTKDLFNIHFSLLPAYRGMYTSAHPILNKEKQTGCTIHEIDAGIDTGNIISQIPFDIEDVDNCKHVYEKYLLNGRELVFRTIDSLIDRSWESKSHPEFGGSYYSKDSINYSNLILDVESTSIDLINQIRAFTFRDYQLPELNGFKIFGHEITKSKSTKDPGEIIESHQDYLVIATLDFDVVLYKDKYNLLMDSINKKDLSEIKSLLIANPFLINEKNLRGWSPLIISSFNGYNEVTSLLLELGANPNETNSKVTTPLMYAKYYAEHSGDTFGIECLISHSADKKLKDIFRKDIYQYLNKTSVYRQKISALI